jgi:hypothetical protein
VVPYPSAGAILNFTHLLFMRASFDLWPTPGEEVRCYTLPTYYGGLDSIS